MTVLDTAPDRFFTVDGTRLVWTGDGEELVVEAWGADSVRIRAAVGPVRDTRWALLDPQGGVPEVAVDGATATLTNGGIVVRLQAAWRDDDASGAAKPHCRVVVLDDDGRVLLSEIEAGGSLKLEARRWRALPGGAHELTWSLEPRPGERLYGMGLYQDGLFDLKGATLELAHRNSQASVPFVLSSIGYGMLWHVPAVGRVVFGTNRTEWTAGATDQLDAWITAGDPATIAARYADATGHAPRMPERGLGFWQSRLRYWNQEQLLGVAREHVRRGLPLDVVVADFFHWPRMGDERFEAEFWPDPAAMVEELRGLGVDLMVSIWPQVSIESENYRLLRQRNALVRTARGMDPQMGFEGPSMFVDTTADQGRELLWELCRRNYAALGIRTYWLDEAEPEWGRYDYGAYRYAAGPVEQVGLVYPQQYSRAFWDGQHAEGQDDVVNLVRCAWAGSQRYGALVWSGDVATTWTALQHQVVAAIQMGVAGIPWFTTDIGGFHGGDPDDPAYRELLVRWFQFGTFCAVMRLHGNREPSAPVTASDGSRRLFTGGANEVWSYGDEAYPILVEHLHLRERLRPYLRRVMDDAHLHGQPVVRALFHEFPADERSWSCADQFLLGPDLLVAPVVQAGVESRRVWLPAGADWVRLADGEHLAGGQEVDEPTPLTHIPVFLRAGGALGHGDLDLAQRGDGVG